MYCAFLVGRSLLAHVRPMTVPRLELCAAVLAVQLKQSIKEELDIPVTEVTFWSDSTCVLQYIKNQSIRFHTFVANRLSIIHELSTPHQWRHVPSELNPVDEVSRGVAVQDMINNSKWLNGPMLLRKNKVSWPRDFKNVENELSDEDPELKPDVQSHNQTLSQRPNEDFLSSLIFRGKN
ncbi:uncharacterized protein LOC122956752 [Acropora millepora]|uniref:uncharacterized protein LOC122956752 n=1 Tax=Acropora millepora TaxID=45264 RepID=UPI001CF153DB|nr:uncharacterized protein LOC122956752 [Acropora millepora]